MGVVPEIITTWGIGVPMSIMLPVILASLKEEDTATATAMFSFMRSFGFIWGITIPAVVFNGQTDHFLDRISDPNVRADLANGGAYSRISEGYVQSLQGQVRVEVVGVYVSSLKTVWQVGIAFAGVGFLLVFLIKHVELRTDLDTKYGLEEKQKEKQLEAEKGEAGVDEQDEKVKDDEEMVTEIS